MGIKDQRSKITSSGDSERPRPATARRMAETAAGLPHQGYGSLNPRGLRYLSAQGPFFLLGDYDECAALGSDTVSIR